MKRSDFPEDVDFVIKDGDRPFAIIFGEGVFSFEAGKRSSFKSSANLGGAERGVPFDRWAALVADIAAGRIVP